MSVASWLRPLRAALTRTATRRPIHKRPARRWRLESLEDRAVPASTIYGTTGKDSFVLSRNPQSGAYSVRINEGPIISLSADDILDGLGDIDTLIGPDTPGSGLGGANVWNLQSASSGSINGTILYQGIETLQGGPENDTFVYQYRPAADPVIPDGGAGIKNVEVWGTGTDDTFYLISNGILFSGINFQSTQVATWGIDGRAQTAGGADVVFFNGTNGNDTLDLTPYRGTNVELWSLNGHDGNDTVIGPDTPLNRPGGANVWKIQSTSSGSTNGTIVCQGIEVIQGGAANDTFTVQYDPIAGPAVTVDGGAGFDQLIGPVQSSTWHLDSTSGGSIDGFITYDRFEVLRGQDGVDTFIFQYVPTANPAAIFGGAGFDVVTVLGTGSDDSFAVSAGNVIGSVVVVTNSLTVSYHGTGIESWVLDGGDGTDTLIGPDRSGATFKLDSDSRGSIGLDLGSLGFVDGVATYDHFEALTGRGWDDVFEFQYAATADPVVAIDGGGGFDTVKIRGTGSADSFAVGPDSITVVTNSVSVAYGGTRIETWDVNGLGDIDTLIGPDAPGSGLGGANVWNLQSASSGSINSAIVYQGIDVLQGGAANDTFVYQYLPAANPIIPDGGAGIKNVDVWGTANDDTFELISNGVRITGISFQSTQVATWGIDGRAQTADGADVVTFIGTNGDDTLDLTRYRGNDVESWTLDGGGGNGTDTLIGPDSENTWDLAGATNGRINTVVRYQAFEVQVGGTGFDLFRFDIVPTSDPVIPDGGGGPNVVMVNGTAAGETFAVSPAGVTVTTTTGQVVYSGTNISVWSVDGRDGTDIIRGPDSDTRWSFSVDYFGGTGFCAFTNIETIVGGSENDTFAFDNFALDSTGDAVGSFHGTIDGGGGTDTLDFTFSFPVNVNLQAARITYFAGFGGSDEAVHKFQGIEAVNFAPDGNLASRLTGENQDSTWAISGPGTGVVRRTGSTSGLSFSGAHRLTAGTGIDTLDYSGVASAVTVNLAAHTATYVPTTVSGFENVVGGTGVNTLIGDGGSNAFTILAGSGTIDGGGGSDTYIVKFGALTAPVNIDDGGSTSDADTLTIHGTTQGDDLDIHTKSSSNWKPFGAVGDYQQHVIFSNVEQVTLNAGAGDDIQRDPSSASLTLLGGPGNDTIIIQDTTGPITADGGEGSDTYIINAGNLLGPVVVSDTGLTGTDAVTINGTAGADTFVQTGNQVTASGPAITLGAGIDSVTVDGGGGSDQLAVNGAPPVPLTIAPLAVPNDPPTARAGGPYTVLRDGTVTLDASGSTDPQLPYDWLAYAWDFDGDGQYDDATGANALFSAAGLATGTYTVRLRVTDSFGASAPAIASVNVVATGLFPDPVDPAKTALFVVGTAGDDTIVVSPSGNGGAVQITMNGASQGTFSPTGRIVVSGQAGNDNLQVSGSVARSVWLYGGTGNDRLKGGDGHDVLLGEDGDDLLVGGSGRNLLIGGKGQDRIVGGSGDDILIAGWTAHDSSPSALDSILREWTRTDKTYAERVSNLKNGGGLNGAIVLTVDTVFSDTDEDKLTGSAGQDWFFYDSTRDKITDLSDAAFANDLPFIGP